MKKKEKGKRERGKSGMDEEGGLITILSTRKRKVGKIP